MRSFIHTISLFIMIGAVVGAVFFGFRFKPYGGLEDVEANSPALIKSAMWFLGSLVAFVISGREPRKKPKP